MGPPPRAGGGHARARPEAAVLGIGGAPLEEFVYDEAGQPLATDW